MSTVQIPLAGKKGKGLFTTVDAADAAIAQQYRWGLADRGKGHRYAIAKAPGPKRRSIYLHRLLLNPSAGMDVDHIDHDGLNNTRQNIRIATRAQNNANRRNTLSVVTSRFKGVSYRNRSCKRSWRATIGINGSIVSLGCYANEADAARAYNRAALKHFGPFARLNAVVPPFVQALNKYPRKSKEEKVAA